MQQNSRTAHTEPCRHHNYTNSGKSCTHCVTANTNLLSAAFHVSFSFPLFLFLKSFNASVAGFSRFFSFLFSFCHLFIFSYVNPPMWVMALTRDLFSKLIRWFFFFVFARNQMNMLWKLSESKQQPLCCENEVRRDDEIWGKWDVICLSCAHYIMVGCLRKTTRAVYIQHFVLLKVKKKSS